MFYIFRPHSGGGRIWGMKNILYTIILSFLFSSGVFADWEIGAKAYNAGDYATALKEFRPLAEQGDADAFFFLGQIYYFGLDVAQNDKEAIAMFSKAIELGNKDAQKFMEEKNLI